MRFFAQVEDLGRSTESTTRILLVLAVAVCSSILRFKNQRDLLEACDSLFQLLTLPMGALCSHVPLSLVRLQNGTHLKDHFAFGGTCSGSFKADLAYQPARRDLGRALPCNPAEASSSAPTPPSQSMRAPESDVTPLGVLRFPDLSGRVRLC